MKTRNFALDTVKVLATIGILLHHAQGYFGFHWAHFNFYDGKFYFGYLVELFFMISGFLTYSSKRNISDISFSDFFIKKCIRLLPMVWITSFAAFIFLYIRWGYYHIWGLIVSCLGLYSLGGEYFDVYKVNSPVWYISCLLLCYILFYIVEFVGRKMRVSTKWIHLGIAVIGMVGLSYQLDLPFFNPSTNRGYFAFFIGVELKWFLDNYGIKKRLIGISGIVIAVFLFCLFFKYELIAYNTRELLTLLVYPATIILTQIKVVTKLHGGKWMEVLSGASFGVYLWHTPLFECISAFNDSVFSRVNLNSVSTLVVFCLVTFAVAIISYYVLEKPITRKLNSAYYGRQRAS